MRIVDKDDKWMDALRQIGKNQIVMFFKDANGDVDAVKTLQAFINNQISSENIQEKYIENKNLIELMCGCVTKDGSKIHFCKNHGSTCSWLRGSDV
jgi:hypothetical protein